jgi:hypothetical protein
VSSLNLAGTGGAGTTAGKGAVAANGMGALDAQHSNGATSVDLAGAGSASASRNPN